MVRGIPFEDLEIGRKFVTKRRTIRESDCYTFVHVTGLTEPLFYDEGFVMKLWGKRIIPGTLTLSVALGLVVQEEIFADYARALLGFDDVRFTSPVEIGDTLYVEFEVYDKKDKASLPGGIVTLKNTVKKISRDGDVVVARFLSHHMTGRKSG